MELAARAGVTQSVISAYESGQRQPAIPALTRLIEAAGFELTAILGSRVDLIPTRDLKPGVRARVERDLVALR